jgi:hypothetical protein
MTYEGKMRAGLLLCLATVGGLTVAPRAADSPTKVRLEGLIREQSTPGTLRVNVLRTDEFELVYLCDGRSKGKWILAVEALANEKWPLPKAQLAFRGPSTYHTREQGMGHRGQGVFFLFDLGPIPEYHEPLSENLAFVPQRQASMVVKAQGANGPQIEKVIEKFRDESVGEFARCRGHSFPRVLHRAPPGEGRPIRQ